MIKLLIKFSIRILFRVKMIGDLTSINVGPVIVISNHDSILDAVLLGLFLPLRARVVMSREDMAYFPNRVLARFVRHYVLDLSEPATVKLLVRALAEGELLVIFPQARVNTTSSAMKLYPSTAIIAMRANVAIVPVTITGLHYSKFGRVSGDFARKWLPPITIRIHAATRLPEILESGNHKRRSKAVSVLSSMMRCAAVDARERQTLYQAFLGAIGTFGRGYRIVEDVRGKHESYGELLTTTLALARIGSRVTAEREIVGVMMPNLSTTACLLLGLSATGRVPAMLNYTTGTEALRNACVAAAIKTVITSRQFIEAARLQRLLDALSGQRIIFVEDLRKQFGLLDKLWLIAWARRFPHCVSRPTMPTAAALVLFTSGSEARPKGVALSHDALLANIVQMRAVIDFSPADRILNALPMFHSYGLNACTLMPLLYGMGLYIYTTPLRYRAIPEIAYLRDCTILVGTSTFLARYGRAAHPYDFYRVRYAISGGEKLSPQVAELWSEKFGLRVFDGYGATECSPVIAASTPLAFKPQTVGRLLPAIESKLVPVDGIARGGRLHVRGPNLMLGYYLFDKPGVLQPPRSEVGMGWHDTGDVVDIDADGFITVLGRVKRFAKIAGEMIALEAVERIAQHASPQYMHAAMVEMIADSGESTVLLTTDAQLTRGTLQRSAKLLGSQDLAVARRIQHVAELPLLGNGKTDYVTLKNLVESTRREPVEINEYPA